MVGGEMLLLWTWEVKIRSVSQMGSRSCLRDAASSWIPRPLSHPSFLPACTSFANTSRFHLTCRRNSRYTCTKHQATCDAQSKPSPVCAVHTIFLPLCWAFHMRSFSLLVGFIETANGIACPPPKERILSTDNCFKTFTHLHDGAAVLEHLAGTKRPAFLLPGRPPTRVRLAWRKLFTANIPTSLVID